MTWMDLYYLLVLLALGPTLYWSYRGAERLDARFRAERGSALALGFGLLAVAAVAMLLLTTLGLLLRA